MKQILSVRRLSYVLLPITAGGVLYFLACMHVLTHLDEFNLIAAYVQTTNSPTNPISFPMPGWLRDVYWEKLGRDRVFQNNKNTNEYAKFLNNAITTTYLPSAEWLDRERAQLLLTQLICVKYDDESAMQDINAFQQKWSSQPFAAAIQKCEGA